MNAEEHARFVGDSVCVIGDARAVGGADFAQHRAALRHDFRNAEAIADLDQFAARDEDFTVTGECGEDEQNSRGAIVDDDRGFGAGQTLQKLRGVNVALAARAGFKVILEVRILRGRAAKFFDCGFGERGAPEVGMKDHAGGVDDGLQRLGKYLFDGFCDFVLQSDPVERKDDRPALFAGDFGAQVGKRRARDFEEQIAVDASRKGGEARLVQQFVDRRNLAEEVGLIRRQGVFRGRRHACISTQNPPGREHRETAGHWPFGQVRDDEGTVLQRTRYTRGTVDDDRGDS